MWTEKQQQAIDAPVSDILVTAAAGSGKTAVMVERIISRVLGENAVDIDRILVVTYTNAAASEIKERVTLKIMEKLEKDSGNEQLQRQLVLAGKASICTIHSFCLDLIRNHFHLLGLDPNFRIGDTLEVELLKSQALDEIFDEAYEQDDPVFLDLVNCFTKKNDRQLVDMVRRLHEFSRSMPDADGWLDGLCASYTGQKVDAVDFLLGMVKMDADYAMGLYDRAIALAQENKLDKWLETLYEERMLFAALCSACDKDWDAAYGVFAGHKFAIRRKTKDCPEDVHEQIKILRDEGKEIAKTIMTNILSAPWEEMQKSLMRMAPQVQMLATLTRRYQERFHAFKTKRNIIDFSDFEHMCLTLLRGENGGQSEVARAVMEKYEEIYVDEYQDCNSVQEAIFDLISRKNNGNPNIFMVGDMKQSIYKFRDANPRLFKRKSDEYPTYDPDAPGAYNRITLNRNFRSRAELLDGVNKIFSCLMSEYVGELTYGEEEMLYPGARYEQVNPDTETIDITWIDTGDNVAQDESADEEDMPLSNVQAEAEYVAKRIAELVEGGNYPVLDKESGEYRPLRYRDVVVLFRSMRGSAEVFADALERNGVPCFSDAGGGYFDTPEVAILIDFLRIVSNPLDDIALAAVMRSGVYGFTDNDFLTLRLHRRDGYFYDAVTYYAQAFEDELAGRLRTFLDELAVYRDSARFMATDEFLWYLVQKSGYEDCVSAMSNAPVRRANVRALFARAQQFERSEFKGIFHFVQHVDKLRKNGSDSDSAKVIGEQDDVVRLMSIHKSKGLEFPVVFLSLCGKKFNTRDLVDTALLHRELGMGLEYVDYEKRFSYPSIIKRAINAKIRLEDLSEEMRVLYVALTRPKEKLFITATGKDVPEKLAALWTESREGTLHPRRIGGAKSFSDWLMMAMVCLCGNPLALSDGREITENGFTLRLVNKHCLHAAQGSEEEKMEFPLPDSPSETDCEESITRALSYVYPHRDAGEMPANVTVTELKRLLSHEGDEVYRMYDRSHIAVPSFMQKGEKPAPERLGTLLHCVMEKIELTQTEKRNTIVAEVERLVQEGYLEQSEADYIDTEKIFAFFQSEVGTKMRRSADVRRELSFKLLLDAEKILGSGKGEQMVVQGTIDACFTDEDGQLILLDYKTDRLSGRSGEEVARRYEVQLGCYAEALEHLLGRKADRCCIYLFDSGETIEI